LPSANAPEPVVVDYTPRGASEKLGDLHVYTVGEAGGRPGIVLVRGFGACFGLAHAVATAPHVKGDHLSLKHCKKNELNT